MKAIFRRELKAYFTSMLGYVFLAIVLLFSGLMFAMNCLRNGTTSLTGYFASMISWTAFILPILTMRIFSEDKKLKTDQLLLTAPIGIHEMVLGKFFAALSVFLISVAVAVIYPFVLSFYGTVPVAETVSCFVGYILYSSCIIAIGAYMSSLTDSQIVAAISTYAIVATIIILENFIGDNLIAVVFLWLSPISRFSDFTMGVLNIESIIYYLSFVAVFVFLTIRTFEKKRWN